MTENKKFPNDKESEEILKARELDILERGEQHSVYDHNGKVVELKAARLWYDELCKYVKPKSSEELTCVIS